MNYLRICIPAPNHDRRQWLCPMRTGSGVACGVKVAPEPVVQTHVNIVSAAGDIDSIYLHHCDSLISGEISTLRFRRRICSGHLRTTRERDGCDQSNGKSSHRFLL